MAKGYTTYLSKQSPHTKIPKNKKPKMEMEKRIPFLEFI
jgi:hypothetical protein